MQMPCPFIWARQAGIARSEVTKQSLILPCNTNEVRLAPHGKLVIQLISLKNEKLPDVMSLRHTGTMAFAP